ncbi:MAG: hypothetical protein JXM79_05625 [Sedimentisphaerales bacterium]|nr:hypothetical protein [Sedimentisphaerales bacterium]
MKTNPWREKAKAKKARIQNTGDIKLPLQIFVFVGIVFTIPLCAKSVNGDTVQSRRDALRRDVRRYEGRNRMEVQTT